MKTQLPEMLIENWSQVFEAALPFALGRFIPLDLNMPMLAGGEVSWVVGSRSKDKVLNAARVEKGTLIASGFIAGGALMGVVSAVLRFANVDMFM